MISLNPLIQKLKSYKKDLELKLANHQAKVDYNQFTIQNGCSADLLEAILNNNLNDSDRRVAFAQAIGKNYSRDISRIPENVMLKKVEEFLNKDQKKTEGITSLNNTGNSIFDSLNSTEDESKKQAIIKLSGIDPKIVSMIESEKDPSKKAFLEKEVIKQLSKEATTPLKVMKILKNDTSKVSKTLQNKSMHNYWNVVSTVSAGLEDRKKAFCQAKGISLSNVKSITRADLKHGPEFKELNTVGLQEIEYEKLKFAKSVNSEFYNKMTSKSSRQEYELKLSHFNIVNNEGFDLQERKKSYCLLKGLDTSFSKYITGTDLERSARFDRPQASGF